jgi:hypothetical protein
MPTVRHPGVLNEVYHETLRLIQAWRMPSQLISPETTLYRAVDIAYFTPITRDIFPRQQANLCLLPRDQDEDKNRFSGKSLNLGVPNRGGLYCSLQQQALMNEVLHYARSETRPDPVTKLPKPAWMPRDPATDFPRHEVALNRKFIIKIRMMGTALLADLSPHNPGARQFVTELENSPGVQAALNLSHSMSRPLWDQLFDSTDCSVARGIGLAVANSPTMRGLQALTVRPSDRSVDETGDNLVWFGQNGQQIPGLWVEEAYVFSISGERTVYRVEA